MMLVDCLTLTIKHDNGFIEARHFNSIYITITHDKLSLYNKYKLIQEYKLSEVLYMQTQGHPRNFIIFS